MAPVEKIETEIAVDMIDIVIEIEEEEDQEVEVETEEEAEVDHQETDHVIGDNQWNQDILWIIQILMIHTIITVIHLHTHRIIVDLRHLQYIHHHLHMHIQQQDIQHMLLQRLLIRIYNRQ